MRTLLPTVLASCIGTTALLATAQPAADPTSTGLPWDPAQMGRTIDAARQARRHGDVMTAERLCYVAFQSVDQSALAAYDAYAGRLHAEDRLEEATVREQSARLHALKAEQSRGTQPTSTYLGFAPSDGLNAPMPTCSRPCSSPTSRSACARSRSPISRCSRRTSSGP